jgi:hypothetical protein
MDAPIMLDQPHAILRVSTTFWMFVIRSRDSSPVAAKMADGDDCNLSLADLHGNRAGRKRLSAYVHCFR